MRDENLDLWSMYEAKLTISVTRDAMSSSRQLAKSSCRPVRHVHYRNSLSNFEGKGRHTQKV